MSNLSIAALMMGAMISGLSGCSHYYSNTSGTNTSISRNNEVASSTPMKVKNSSSEETEASVTISSLEMYGWWWSDEQLASDFDADNPPPKKSYIRLNQWDASQPDSPHPDRIDIICHLENHTNAPIDLSLEAFADFKVASYEAIAKGSGTQDAVDEKLKQIQWTDNRKLDKVIINRLLPGELREAQFKDFNLDAVTDKYLKSTAGDFWPWKLRVSIVARTSKGVRIAYTEATINLVPGD